MSHDTWEKMAPVKISKQNKLTGTDRLPVPIKGLIFILYVLIDK